MTNIAIDFGGTTIKIGLVRSGVVLAKTGIPAQSSGGLLPRLDDVERTVHRLLADAGLALDQCKGVGMAVPGLTDPMKSTLLSINEKYADAAGMNFGDWASDRFGLGCHVLENDARAALLGETAYGVSRGIRDSVLMIFGTGIGTAVMIDGQILRGRHHQAGVLGGHLTTDVHGSICTCGNIGCVEAQAGHWALEAKIKKHPGFSASLLQRARTPGYQAIVDAATAGDGAARDILDELVIHWSAGIINLIHAYDPEVVVLSGGLMNAADLIVPKLAERVHRLAWTPWGKVRFEVAGDPESSVLLGTSYLLEQLSASRRTCP